MSGHPPLSFLVFSENIAFFENIVKWKIIIISLAIKNGYIHFYRTRKTPLPLKIDCLSQRQHFSVFSWNIKFFEKITKWKIIQNLISYGKNYIHFFDHTPRPSKMVVTQWNGFLRKYRCFLNNNLVQEYSTPHLW